MKSLLQAIDAEVSRAEDIHGQFNSTHEALGVLLEEFDELKEAIHANNRTRIWREDVQVAAVAYRLALQCTNGEEAFGRRSGLTVRREGDRMTTLHLPGKLPKPSAIQKYEQAKQAWTLVNPAATPQQYQKAMTDLARRFGV